MDSHHDFIRLNPEAVANHPESDVSKKLRLKQRDAYDECKKRGIEPKGLPKGKKD